MRLAGCWLVSGAWGAQVLTPSVLEVILRVDLRAPICRARFGGFWGHIGAQSVQVQFWGSFLHLRTSCANLVTMPQNQAPQISGRKSTRKMTSRTEGVRIWGPHAPLTSQQPVGRAGGQRPKHVGRLGTDPRTPHGVLAAVQGAGGQWPYPLGPGGHFACRCPLLRSKREFARHLSFVLFV